MKSTNLVGLFLFSLSAFAYDVKIRVIDDQGGIVSGARARIAFVMFRNETDIERIGTTNEDGTYSANGRGEHSVSVTVTKTGYYQARLQRLAKDKDLDLVIVIPRVLDPVALFACDTRIGRAVRAPSFPVQGVWLGYDFEGGDWVQPHGKGRVTDIRFKFRNEFKGWKSGEKAMETNRRVNRGASEDEIRNVYGKWDAELEISFPGEKEGIFEEKRFLSYSQLKLPHSAPLDGYVPTWRYTANSYSPRTARENVGFFLRTRVKLDQNGRVIAANYAKVVGDFYLVPQGSLMFCYYFNPVPNDRNLEFDPKRNLFPPNLPGANVGDP